MSRRIVVLTKAPIPGQVKTRLGESIGHDAAAAIHEALVFETLRLAMSTGLPVTVSMALDPGGSFTRRIQPLGVSVEAQAGGDLGDRLLHAMRHPGRTIALGSDCVVFDPKWLVACARDPADVSIGPAEDGGYWAIALDGSSRSLAASAFTDMPWSTPTLLQETCTRLRSAGFSVNTLPASYDVDDVSGLQRLAEDQRCAEPLRSAIQRLL